MGHGYPASSRRISVYDNAKVYSQAAGIKPGFLTKMLLAGVPSLMGCFGRMHGCMQCIIYRATIRLDTIICSAPCMIGMGSFCGAAAGEAVKKYWSTFSVVCSELFRQVSPPAFTYHSLCQLLI
jgi:hypothetical protein